MNFFKNSGGSIDARKGLIDVIGFRRKGDSLVVWKLDRLGRSLRNLIDTINLLQAKDVEFVSLQESVDTTTSGGKLVFHVFGALAEFEREMITEAQQPFITDDADVTEKGKFHFEFSNQHDVLKTSAFPTKRQNTASFELAYGLIKNVEISIETPLLTLVNDRQTAANHLVTGIGDINLAMKYNFFKE